VRSEEDAYGRRRNILRLAAAIIGIAMLAMPAAAQVTTGTLTGTVKDAQGGVIPGATVTLTSDTRGTQLPPVVSNTNGDFTFVNVPPDTYTIQILLEGFQTLRRSGVPVSAGDRYAIGALAIEVGGLTDTVSVTGEMTAIQASSGERSFTVAREAVENLPVASPQLHGAGGPGAWGYSRHQRHAGPRQNEARLLAGSRWQKTGVVFASTIGTPLDERNVRREFYGFLQAAQLPRIRVHDLRHSCTTILLAVGEHPKVVQEMLGHQSVQVTLEPVQPLDAGTWTEGTRRPAFGRDPGTVKLRPELGLNWGRSDDPDFHQLEPDGELAKPSPGAPRSRIIKRAGVYESLPAEWG
jgi:hypothetical protein